MPKISVIVPVYNTEQYLPRCIDSILAQTFTDFELLLIDDGSKDGSGKICDEYAAKDLRVRVFHKENGGVSSARNIGLDNAKGGWISFVDSDDWISTEYLENLFNAVDNTVDLVVAYAHLVDYQEPDKFEFPDYLIDINNIDILFSKFAFSWRTAPWSKLFRNRIIQLNSLQFKEGMHIGEDAHFIYRYILHCNRNIKNINKKDYHYYYDNIASLTKTVNSIETELISHDEISATINDLVSLKHITDPNALRELTWLKSVYINRVLNALYENKCNKSTRLKTIKHLDIDSFLSFRFLNESAYGKIQKLLLKRKMYYLYDLFRIVTKSIRKAIKRT